MKRILLLVIFYYLSFNLYATPYGVNRGYDCESLNGHLENQLATAPEREIRTSLNNWEEHRGEIPALEIPLVNVVYILCEEERNAERQVKDIVFDILEQAEYRESLASRLKY
ncbi:hypothetical protein [Shewanella fidelis]|uniref:hypothetical protein n=1 Tax=Shewanella fidelis TaxID=173509 RepID=UPI000490D922|nr:hypothetical protein [Shewanella fidelis]